MTFETSRLLPILVRISQSIPSSSGGIQKEIEIVTLTSSYISRSTSPTQAAQSANEMPIIGAASHSRSEQVI